MRHNLYTFEDWKRGSTDLSIIADSNGKRIVWYPEPTPEECPEDCWWKVKDSCPQQLMPLIKKVAKAQAPVMYEFRRPCDSMWCRSVITASVRKVTTCPMTNEAGCAIHHKLVLLRITTLDPSWDSLTGRERELVSVSRKTGFETCHKQLGISKHTTWAHRRSIVAKADLVGAAAWHRFVLQNG